MSDYVNYDAMFSGVIGQDYEMLKLICPLMVEMSRLVGEGIQYYPSSLDKLSVVELGGGTGITTLALLSARKDIHLISIDNEPTMQDQAKANLADWQEDGKLEFSNLDVLTALQCMPSESVDIIASAYTLHNLIDAYRQDVINECYRVLKSGGLFINGDRYGLDDIAQHTRMIQEEVTGYFKVLINAGRLDLLEHWIVHLFSDESENHVMRESVAIQQLKDAGFSDILLTHRMAVNALVKATKSVAIN